jgi:ABC-type transporter Mla MlaB component
MDCDTVTIDMAQVQEADIFVVDALARLCVALKRRDQALRVINVPDQLRELVSFMGLDDVLGVEMQGHTE